MKISFWVIVPLLCVIPTAAMLSAAPEDRETLPGRQVKVAAIAIGYGGDHDKKLKQMDDLAADSSKSLTGEYPAIMSGEQHIPIIDAIANDKETVLQLNIPNRGAIPEIPNDVVVEIPTLVTGRGLQGITIGSLPRRLMKYAIEPRMRRMEQITQAYQERDRTGLLLMLMDFGLVFYSWIW